MKSTGIRRKIDDLGRVVIPAGIRRSLDMREGDAIEVSVDGDKVVLSKPIDQCVFCGSEDSLQDFRAKRLCRPCVAALGVMDEQLRVTTRADAAATQAAAPAASAEVPDWGLDGRGASNRAAPPAPPRVPATPAPARATAAPEPTYAPQPAAPQPAAAPASAPAPPAPAPPAPAPPAPAPPAYAPQPESEPAPAPVAHDPVAPASAPTARPPADDPASSTAW